jgi:hypothetical protein
VRDTQRAARGCSTSKARGKAARARRLDNSDWPGTLDLALAYGFILRTKVDGWKLFCERLNVPPLLLWQVLPSFDWLRDSLTLREGSDSVPFAAFADEGFLRWLNANRPSGHPELTEVPLTVERVASANRDMFEQRVKWWGG